MKYIICVIGIIIIGLFSYKKITKAPMNKAIIVLGYSLNEDCSLHPLLEARLNKARSLYKAGTPIVVTGGSPAGKPKACKMSEAEAMKTFLVKKGVSENDIFLEEFSLTTFMNAFYTLTLHLYPMGIKEAYIISNDFHMPLVKYCFNLIYNSHVKVKFVSAPNTGLNHEEVKKWETLIQKVTLELYPILFNKTQPGDLRSIHSMFNDAKKMDPGPLRLQFEAQMRKIRSLKDDVSLYGII